MNVLIVHFSLLSIHFDSNNFNATLQVNSSRPVYNATYTSPVLNLNDKDVQFKYVEFENFIYDQNAFTSNLVSILSFYAHVVIGADADTFANKGGTEFYEKALTVSNMAQSSGYTGWVQTGKKSNALQSYFRFNVNYF